MEGKFRFTTIAHADHKLCSPISDEKLNRLIDVLRLPPNARVLDIATGKAELLIRIIERYNAAAVGVDHSPWFLAEARSEITRRIPDTKIELHEIPAAEFTAPPESFDLTACVGARPFGSHRDTLTKLASWTRPAGLVLVGEGYWRQSPHDEYLQFLGANIDDYTTHEGNVRQGIDAGLTPIYTAVADQSEFDHYEGLYLQATERFLKNNPDAPDADALRTRMHSWRDNYFRHGRDTLGFALYLYMK